MIILVTIGEPVPIIDDNQRLMRCFNLGLSFSKLGNEVIWITDSFNHQKKLQRNVENLEEIQVNDNFKIKFIKTISYKKNYSLFRIFHNLEFAIKFYKLNKYLNFKKRTFIFSYPILESCIVGALIKRDTDKFIVDIRDLWPDVFKDRINIYFFRIINTLYKIFLKFIFKKLDLLVSTSKGYLEWSKRYGLVKNQYFLPIGYHVSKYENKINHEFKKKFEKNNNSKQFNILFIGTITNKYFDFNDIFLVSKFLEKNNINHKIFIAGFGEDYESIKLLTNNRVEMLGQLNGNELEYLMSISSIGIAPYKRIPNFENNIPNKIYEYAYGNLYILTSLKGEVKEFVEDNKFGFCYSSSDDMTKELFRINKLYGYKKFMKNNDKKSMIDSNEINNQFIEYLKRLNYI